MEDMAHQREPSCQMFSEGFQCDVIVFRFAKKSHLEGHMATHTKQKNHACDICSKTFSRRSHLRLHLLKHTGERDLREELASTGNSPVT